MTRIAEHAASALAYAKPFKSGNTQVIVEPNVTVLTLFDNAIAYRYNDPERTLSITNCGWNTPTTKDHLNAIVGVDIVQRKGQWYLNGEPWNGELIDVELS